MGKRRIEQKGNAVIYARYSSHNQREESIEQQIAKCREYAARAGLNVIGVYYDSAVSGKTDARPQFQKMLKDSAKGGFDYVIAWKSNRMGRNMLQAMVNEERLAEEGVKCLYVEEDFEDNAAGRFALRNMMNVNQFYSENMAEDIVRGLMDNASKCMMNTRAPMGYKKGEDGRFAIDEKNAEIVREIFNRFLDGWSFTDIAKDLNRRGIKTAIGNEWNKNSFHRMLVNENYIGVYKYSSVRVEGGVPEIIDRETFEEVQIRLNKKNPVGKKRNTTEYLLTGKLFCGHCKNPMVGISGTGKHGDLHYYYACQGHRKKLCDKKNVTRESIEKAVIHSVRDYVCKDETIDWIVNGYIKFQESARKDSALKALTEELKQTETALGNLLKALEMGIFTETTQERMKELEEKRKSLEADIRIERAATKELTPDQIRFWLERFKSGDIEDKDFQTELIKVFVQAIFLYDDYLKIVFNYDNSEGMEVPISEIEALEGEPVTGSYKLSSPPPT